MTRMPPTGVVVAQLGGPECLAEVKPFIRAIFADPHLVPLPGGPRTRSAMSSVVATLRAPKSRTYYEAIGGGSPIVATTQHQADALFQELSLRGHDVVVTVAQRHSKPDTESAVDLMLSAGVSRIILLPLFPQYSGTTTGSSEARLRLILEERDTDLHLDVIRSWCEHPSYLDAQTQLVEEMLSPLSDADEHKALVIFSAHGLPQGIVDGGDPYQEEIEATVAGVMKRLTRSVDHVIAYQSRAGPMKWLTPDVRDVVSSAAKSGREWLGVVPISFVSEHVETSYELDIELNARAAGAGIAEFHRSRCFDLLPIVGPMLADITEECL